MSLGDLSSVRMKLTLEMGRSAGGCGAVLSQTPAGSAWGPSVRRGEGGRRHRDPKLQAVLQGGDLLG